MDCILCAAPNPVCVAELPTATLVREWWVQFRIDVGPVLARYASLPRFRCLTCGLEFFPPELAGSPSLYRALQQFSWYYMPHKWEHAVALHDIPPAARVLEVGCAVGDFVARLKDECEAEVEGIELNPEAVSEAQSRGRPVTQRNLAEVSAERPSFFDVVCSFQVLEHVPTPRDFLRHSLALLKPGGKLIVAVPHSDSFLKYQTNLLDMPPHHITRWSTACLSHLSPLLGIRLARLVTEPLAPYHIDAYVNSHAQRLRSHPFGSLLANRLTRKIASALLRTTPLPRFLRGQSIYACYTTL